jgi:hypothetical protein
MCTCKYTVASTHRAIHEPSIRTHTYMDAAIHTCTYTSICADADLRRSHESLGKVTYFPMNLAAGQRSARNPYQSNPKDSYEWRRREAGGCATRTHAQQRTRRTRPASWQRRPVRRVGAASAPRRSAPRRSARAPATAMCSAYTSWTVLNTFPATDARSRARRVGAQQPEARRGFGPRHSCRLACAPRAGGKGSAALRALVLRYSGYSHEGRSATHRASSRGSGPAACCSCAQANKQANKQTNKQTNKTLRRGIPHGMAATARAAMAARAERSVDVAVLCGYHAEWDTMLSGIPCLVGYHA